MDLHLTQHRASHAEMNAVNSVLGVSQAAGKSSANGFEDSGNGRSGVSPRRDLLLPVLHAIQSRIGWISPGAVNFVAERMNLPPAEVYGVASFYEMFSLSPRPPIVAHVCDDIACLAKGAEKLCGELQQTFGLPGKAVSQNSTWLRVPCLGLCERAPAARLSAAGESLREKVIAPASADSIQCAVREAEAQKLPIEPDVFNAKISAPQARSSQNRLLRHVGLADATSLEGYRKQHGFEALRRAMEIGPKKIVREVIDSGLLGRGGAAFPTGKKWEALLEQKDGRPHYVVCNADESEPGTFKDRILIEGDPFAILEGMIIAAIAVGARKGYIYLRGEYPFAAARLTHAIHSARREHFLGEHILGSESSFDIELRRGAGAYICGEETALFNSIEGYRGEPRNKPPFPTQAGLFRQPTIVNNVETLANIPHIISEGASAFAAIGTKQSTGTRLFCISGQVVHPGVYEVAFGTTLGELISLAGGIAGSGKLQAVLLGGAAGSFLSPSELDSSLTFEGTKAIGATLGSGAVVLFDDTIDLRQILLRISRFFRAETCGQCVPCRVGVTRQEEALQRLAAKRPLGSADHEFRLLKEMAQAMRDASICGLGQTAPNAILSALDRWSLFA